MEKTWVENNYSCNNEKIMQDKLKELNSILKGDRTF